MKKKILVLADSPTCNSGFGQVTRNILKEVYKQGNCEIDIVGVNHDGTPYDKEKYPYNIYPAKNPLIPRYNDYFGRQLFLDLLVENDYDVVWILQDTFNIYSIGEQILQIRREKEKNFKWIYYFPIDATPEKEWIEKSALLADYPVVYTKYGKEECLKVLDETNRIELRSKLKVIYHGTNSEDFYDLKWTKEEKKAVRTMLFGEENADKFIFMNINRNQPRKDVFSSMLTCKLTRETDKDSYFYFHMQIKDDAGLDMLSISDQLGLKIGKDWACPNPKVMMSHSFDIKTVNELYNAVDCVFSTTLGEGWGLSTTEAMATRTPVVIPKNTSAEEIIGEGKNKRGVLVDCGTEENLFIANRHDNNRIRPKVDVFSLEEELLLVKNNIKEITPIIDNAYRWVKSYEWSGKRVGGKWLELFNKAYEKKYL